MATYGKRFERESTKGQMLADLLGLKQSKDGYYFTMWGKKTCSGLYATIREFMQSVEFKNAGKD